MTIEVQRSDGGGSALRQYQRRIGRRDASIQQRWGTRRVGRLVKVVGPAARSTEAWARGAAGERMLAACLARRTSDDVVLLHDRAVHGRTTNIDHIAVASSGVWVIDAKRDRGRVERRDLGTWRSVDDRLYVDGRDRTRLVRGLNGPTAAVRSRIEPLGIDTPIHRVLCFVDADWGLFAKPFAIDGVTVTYPSALAAAVSVGGLLLTADVRAIAAELDRTLPTAGP